MRYRLGTVVLALSPLLVACSGTGVDDRDAVMVTSIYPFEYVAERIGGQRLADSGVDLVSLTSPGQDPHDLELTVDKTAAIEEADVVLYVAGLQPAVDEAVLTAEPRGVLEGGELAGRQGDDPHVWLDPERLARVAEATAEWLTELDPDGASTYEANLTALGHDLADLDRRYRTGLADCRVSTVVVGHDAFGYLEKYGLEFAAISGLSPGAEPSAARLAELRDLVEAEDVTTVFFETLTSPEAARTLAAEAGVRTDVLDPLEGLADDSTDYLGVMEQNLANLREAGGCR